MSKYIKREHILAEIDYAEGLPCGSPIAAYEIVKAIIDDAPTIEVPTWIPCEERLPEYLEEVLMSTFWGVRVGFRDHTERSGDFWNIIENDSTVAPHSVYAWMPLPRPYEETDHE